MKVLSYLLAGLFLCANSTGFAADNCTATKKTAVCTEDSVKERVEWACKLIEAKGKAALPEIHAMRYECCGEPNYVWVQDTVPTMIEHPMKPELNGKNLSTNTDPKGKKLFVEFVNMTKKSPAGAWVDYQWTKFGESTATPKKSWVKRCKTNDTKEEWIVGSGTWL